MRVPQSRHPYRRGYLPVNPPIWVVIPVYNEAFVLPTVIPSILRHYSQVVFIDDGSTDDTFQILQQYPAHLLKHDFNLGQGAALRLGIAYALANEAQIIVTMDVDGQMDPADIGTLVRPLVDGKADIVIGTRFGFSSLVPANIPLVREWLLRSAVHILNFAWDLQLTDPQNGFRAMTAAAARTIKISQNRMAHTFEIIHQIKKHRLMMAEAPVKISYTPYSLEKGQKLSNIFNILWESLFSLPIEPRLTSYDPSISISYF